MRSEWYTYGSCAVTGTFWQPIIYRTVPETDIKVAPFYQNKRKADCRTNIRKSHSRIASLGVTAVVLPAAGSYRKPSNMILTATTCVRT